jgi:transcriptional regulator with XRE-family HTH domain
MSAGLNIKILRTKLGLNQINFAKKLKIHQVTVSDYETNKIIPSAKIIRLMMKLALKEGIEIRCEDLMSVSEENIKNKED